MTPPFAHRGAAPDWAALARALETAPGFDAEWYCATYRDVAATGLGPALHYVRYGAALGRDPGPEVTFAQWRRAHPAPDGTPTAVWLARVLGVTLAHAPAPGGRAGRAPLTAKALRKAVGRVRLSLDFDAGWYAQAHADVAASGMDPASHYVLIGGALGRDPGPRFSAALWHDLNPEAPAGTPALLAFQAARRRDPEILPPRRENVMFAAGLRDRAGDHAGAVALAERHLPPDLAHAAAGPRANAALARGDRAGWLAHLNGYLGRADLAPLREREGSGPLFERLETAALAPVADGPLVSVLMPAFNAERTIAAAARSILGQTWRRLELIVIDDASTDGTAAVVERLAAEDDRLRLIRTPVNAGPYVAKNIGLSHARGAWITGQDADDWSHPERLARHMGAVLEKGTLTVSLTQAVRMDAQGRFTYFDRLGVASPDGVARRFPITCLFAADFLRNRLGHWDSVRFAADSEMIGRAMALLGERFAVLDQPSMLSLDTPTSITNDSVHGVDKLRGLSPAREAYRAAWRAWHATLTAEADAALPFPHTPRRFAAPAEMQTRVTPESLALYRANPPE